LSRLFPKRVSPIHLTPYGNDKVMSMTDANDALATRGGHRSRAKRRIAFATHCQSFHLHFVISGSSASRTFFSPNWAMSCLSWRSTSAVKGAWSSGGIFCLVRLRGFEPLTRLDERRFRGSLALVMPFNNAFQQHHRRTSTQPISKRREQAKQKAVTRWGVTAHCEMLLLCWSWDSRDCWPPARQLCLVRSDQCCPVQTPI